MVTSFDSLASNWKDTTSCKITIDYKPLFDALRLYPPSLTVDKLSSETDNGRLLSRSNDKSTNRMDLFCFLSLFLFVIFPCQYSNQKPCSIIQIKI